MPFSTTIVISAVVDGERKTECQDFILEDATEIEKEVNGALKDLRSLFLNPVFITTEISVTVVNHTKRESTIYRMARGDQVATMY